MSELRSINEIHDNISNMLDEAVVHLRGSYSLIQKIVADAEAHDAQLRNGELQDDLERIEQGEPKYCAYCGDEYTGEGDFCCDYCEIDHNDEREANDADND